MQEHSVILTNEAIYDIVEIEEYIEDYFSYERSEKFRKDIYDKIYGLSSKAGLYGDTEISYRGYKIYMSIFSPSLIFYVIRENGVHVLRVLREERDWKRIISVDKDYTYPE